MANELQLNINELAKFVQDLNSNKATIELDVGNRVKATIARLNIVDVEGVPTIHEGEPTTAIFDATFLTKMKSQCVQTMVESKAAFTTAQQALGHIEVLRNKLDTLLDSNTPTGI